MKFRSTLILLAICGALIAYVYFWDRHQKTTQEVVQGAGRIVEVDQKNINAVSIKNAEGKIELRKHEGEQWVLEESVKDRADTNMVIQLFTAVDQLRSQDTVTLDKDKEQQLKEFGLADSNTKARFTGTGKPLELIFGKDTAVQGKTYLYVEGGDKVYAVNDELKNLVSKKVDDFRDRKLTDLTMQKVTKLQIKSAAGELELEKKNNHWSLLKPMQARGDDGKINDLISQSIAAHIDQFVSDPNLANFGLSEPRGTLTFTVEGSDKPVVLQIGANPKEAKDKEKVYVKLSTRDTVVLVPKGLETALTATPNALRDRSLLRAESDIVDRITVETGAEKLVLARKGEGWVRKEGDKDQEINPAMATRLLADLQAAMVGDFVSDVATDLPKYGLDNPVAKVTLSSFSSQNTAETTAGDKPIVQVLFGKNTEKPGEVYAKLDTEPFIVTVPRNALDSVPKSAIELQDLAITSFKPEELTNLEVGVGGQPSIGLERQKDGTWKLTKGEGKVTQANVTSLANSLSGLRAVRWIGPVAPDHGFEHPIAVVSYTSTKGDQKAPGKLTLGAANAEGLNFAQAEGLNGVFLVSRPDADAMLAPLTDKQTPPVTSVTSPPLAVPGTPEAIVPGAPVPGPSAPMPPPTPAPPAPVPMTDPVPPAPNAPAPMPALVPPTPTPAPAAEPVPVAPVPAPPVTPMPAPAPAPAPEAAPSAPVPPVAPAPAPMPAPVISPTPSTAPEKAAPAPTSPVPVPTVPVPAPPATNPPAESVTPAAPVTPAPAAAPVPPPSAEPATAVEKPSPAPALGH